MLSEALGSFSLKVMRLWLLARFWRVTLPWMEPEAKVSETAVRLRVRMRDKRENRVNLKNRIMTGFLRNAIPVEEPE